MDDTRRIERDDLDRLIEVLAREHEVLGPVVREEAIVWGPVRSTADLPRGWTDEQEGGRYRLRRRDDEALFGYAVGPHSAKRFLYPPEVRLWRASRAADGRVAVEVDPEPAPRYAFLGLRACELAAIAVQDRVLLGEGPAQDPVYAARREQAFFVAVHCGSPAGTCFCVSMDTGPRARGGFDLALTEVLADGAHYFVAEVGSDRGAAVLAEVPSTPAAPAETGAAERVTTEAAGRMGRRLDTAGLADLLQESYDHPRWDDVAERCLSCANCTLVCPTCFCTTVADTTDLTGDHAERWRRLDSCFNLEFSYLHGGSVRSSTRSRYRQWMTHKLSTWWDQFGTTGCIGCGRCVTWCPVGIDITEESAAIQADAGAPRAEDDGS